VLGWVGKEKEKFIGWWYVDEFPRLCNSSLDYMGHNDKICCDCQFKGARSFAWNDSWINCLHVCLTCTLSAAHSLLCTIDKSQQYLVAMY
jgi:hypothetical protein